ncbi:ArnT family glycosyltransferase [Hippea jasoniae]|uniref:ArnT family glycosyltransferase n=1 Tax=Hippea jasoniae TaxID=944479 RepID=UPI00054D4C04|nr:glycosyltransferase family 39 protein [Hippea jasoniae]
MKESRYIFLIVVAGLIFFAARIYEPTLSGDSLKHALVAKSMVLRGDWLNLYLYDHPYLKKPPLYFWLIAFSFKVFGISALSARIPVVLFGILDGVLIYLLAKELFKNSLDSFIAAMFFIVNFHVIRLTSIVRMESIITFFILLNLFLLLKRRYLLAGVALGFGILTKGPVAFLGVATFAIWKIITGGAKELFDFRFIGGLFIAAVVGGWWYVYQYVHHTGFFDEFFKRQIIDRINGELNEGSHRNYLFYFKRLLSRFWPGLLFFVIGLYSFFKEKLYRDRVWQLFAIYAVLTFIVINIPKEKFTRYLYYCYPSFVLFASEGVRNLKLQRIAHQFFIFISFAFLIVAIFYKGWFHKPFHYDSIKHDVYAKICDRLSHFSGSCFFKGISAEEKHYFLFFCLKNPYASKRCVIFKTNRSLRLKFLSP